MALRVLIDTNVLLDYLTKRVPFFPFARSIVSACERGAIEGRMAAHSVLNMFFILRHDFSAEERRAMLKKLCLLLPVVGVDGRKLLAALERDTFPDLEDCVQMHCALACGAEYIITRDQADFADSVVPAILPDVFCRLFLDSGEKIG